MAFQGTLVEIEGVQLPNRYVCGFRVTPDRRTDKDSYQDGNGKLNRTILPHKRSGFIFNTGYITDNDIQYLKSIFDGRDKVNVRYWKPTTQKLESGEFYVPDFEFEVLLVLDSKVYYRPIELEFIEY